MVEAEVVSVVADYACSCSNNYGSGNKSISIIVRGVINGRCSISFNGSRRMSIVLPGLMTVAIRVSVVLYWQ